jgi:hypothetical protein
MQHNNYYSWWYILLPLAVKWFNKQVNALFVMCTLSIYFRRYYNAVYFLEFEVTRTLKTVHNEVTEGAWRQGSMQC